MAKKSLEDQGKEQVMRKEINGIVRQYAMEHDGCYAKAWNELYKLYNKVFHYDLKKKAAKNKVKPLDLVEKENNLEYLKMLAESMFAA